MSVCWPEVPLGDVVRHHKEFIQINAIVSSHYFLFGINVDRIARHFLDFFVRTPGFREQVTAQGSTNYAAIRPANVLGYRVPLPPLSVQRRIVARIEEMAAKIEEAKRLRVETQEFSRALLKSKFASIIESAKRFPISEVAPLVRRPDVQYCIRLGGCRCRRKARGSWPCWFSSISNMCSEAKFSDLQIPGLLFPDR